ncbi:hypothetical protein Gotri_011373 [Gossypium trilobum]|uniref:Defective in cullin neddylation protein n=1 Tax=Gossypium trilobum TaxID=34281 RepID=A0A7J9ETJ9_9ROSI|nr:hypothetical protein [Gossypium trilobum]
MFGISWIFRKFIFTYKFHDIYNFAFSWAKEKGQKSMALNIAIGMWRLLFAEKKCPLLDHWCQFLQVLLKHSVLSILFFVRNLIRICYEKYLLLILESYILILKDTMKENIYPKYYLLYHLVGHD